MEFPTDNDFKTIPNNGMIEIYSNACLWISIKMILRCYRIQKSVRTLRTEAGFTGKDHEMFDISKGHLPSLQRSANINNLQVEIYYYNMKDGKGFIGNMAWKIGSGRRCPIVAYGGHFEPIVYCPIYGINILDSMSISKYIPKTLVKKEYEPIKNLDDRFSILQMRVAEEQNFLNGLLMEHNSYFDEKQKLEDKRGENIKAIDLLQLDVNKYRDQFDSITSQQQSYIDMQQYIDTDEEMENAYMRISQLQGIIDSINGDIERTINSISKLTGENTKLFDEIENITKKMDSRKIKQKMSEIDVLNKQISDFEKNKNDKQVMKVQKEITIKKYCSEIFNLQGVINDLKDNGDYSEAKELEKKLRNKKKKLNKML